MENALIDIQIRSDLEGQKRIDNMEKIKQMAGRIRELEAQLAELKKGAPFAYYWQNKETLEDGLVYPTDGYTKEQLISMTPLYLSPVIPEGYQLVPVEPITGKNYEQGLWSRRNWDAAIEDMLSACKGE